MYYEIPVPWVHHKLCNGMECSKHSMVKSPYLFSTCNMDARNIKFLRTHNLVRQDYSRIDVQCPNKLSENNDDLR